MSTSPTAGSPAGSWMSGAVAGCCCGEFQKLGWEVSGTELSDSAARYAREMLKFPVHLGRLADLHLPDNCYDAIVLWHVLEHLLDAGDILAEVRRLLRPGGVLLVGVPNFGSIEVRLTRNKWFHLDVPRHVTHFTPASLEHTLSAAGLKIRRTSYFAPEYDCFSFIQSALNLLGFRHNLLYMLLRHKNAKPATGRRPACADAWNGDAQPAARHVGTSPHRSGSAFWAGARR